MVHPRVSIHFGLGGETLYAFFGKFFTGKYGLRENMWCLIKGFSELIQYVGRKNPGH